MAITTVSIPFDTSLPSGCRNLLYQHANLHLADYDSKGSDDLFGLNYPRLQKLKAQYDPGNVFNKQFAVTPKA